MSQFFAEAEVLIRPNTVGFAAQLVEKVNAEVLAAQAAIKPLMVTAAVTTAPVGAGVAAGAAESAAAITAQGAATERAAAATADLARAQTLGNAAMAAEAKIATAAALSTTELGAAKATLAAANKAVAAGERAVGAALAAGNIALIDAASANLNLARSEATVAEAAAVEAAAISRSSAGVAAHQAHLSQLGRGAGTAGLSFLGLRAQVLAASGAFVAGAAGALILRKSIAAASDRTEQLNKSVEVFTTSAADVQKWAQTTATAMGISETAALQASATYGGFFRTLGIGSDQAARMSETLVKLASDMASFNNVPVDRALQAIQSGLVGQVRPLRTLNVFLTAARVNQEALAETGKKTTTALTDQDKILARYNIILRDSFIQTGDFARTQERLANQSRILSAQLADLSAQIGGHLVPGLTRVVQDTNAAVDAFGRLAGIKIKIPIEFPIVGGKSGQTIGGFLADSLKQGILNIPVAGQGLQVLVDLDRILNRYRQSQEKLPQATRNSQEASVELARELRGMQSIFDAAAAAGQRYAAALQAVEHRADVLTQQQEQIRAGVLPGGRSAEEANLQKQIAAQQAIIDTATIGSKKYRDALRKKKQLMDELAGLQAQDAADAQAAQQKIQTARDKADQALQSIITARTSRVDVAKALAAGTPQTIDDLNALKLERATIRNIINNIIPLIKDEATKQALYQQWNLALIQTNNEIAALVKTRREGNAARRQAALDAQQAHLEKLITIAQTTPGTADDLRTLRAYKEFLLKRIAELKAIKKRTQEQNAALDDYRVALAQTNESIRNIVGEQKKGNTFAQQAFAFLQTQQGFVSNLLGNLIPGGLTSGLVGGQPTVPSNAPRQVAGGFEQPRGVNFTAGEAARTRPPSAAQSERQIDWLRKIYAALVDLKRGNEHPEAKHQRSVGSSAMDFHIQGTYGM